MLQLLFDITNVRNTSNIFMIDGWLVHACSVCRNVCIPMMGMIVRVDLGELLCNQYTMILTQNTLAEVEHLHAWRTTTLNATESKCTVIYIYRYWMLFFVRSVRL